MRSRHARPMPQGGPAGCGRTGPRPPIRCGPRSSPIRFPLPTPSDQCATTNVKWPQADGCWVIESATGGQNVSTPSEGREPRRAGGRTCGVLIAASRPPATLTCGCAPAFAGGGQLPQAEHRPTRCNRPLRLASSPQRVRRKSAAGPSVTVGTRRAPPLSSQVRAMFLCLTVACHRRPSRALEFRFNV